jgi:selenium metabolism protein YedF
MGRGESELGLILMKSFINNIPKQNPLPRTMLFYNSGIFLTLQSSAVIETLHELEKNGVEMLICGTCLDFYGQKNAVAAGKISNMHEISSCLNKADKIIYP